jgi:hypothetical protein
VNGDGYWSHEDSLPVTGKSWTDKFGKQGNLTRIFRGYLKEAKNGGFRYQKKNMLNEESSSSATAKYTRIPMQWMRVEQPVIHLCNNIDPALCGNLELRGILKTLDLGAEFSADDRIEECRNIYDQCLPKFGELWRSYTKNVEQTCGAMSSSWDSEANVIVNRYETADKYDPYENKQAIPTLMYETFLLLVLIIWWLIVIGELRQVLAWWMVFLWIPSEKTVVEQTADSIKILGVSVTHKVIVFIMVIIPRTIIIVGLSYIGTDFLIIADSYSDLILNSVALGFLIEVDDMLFAAVTSSRTKENINKLQPLESQHSCSPCCVSLGQYPTSIPLVFFVVGMACAQMAKAFFWVHGKVDLSGAYGCLCHMEGPACIAAQILGGKTRV